MLIEPCNLGTENRHAAEFDSINALGAGIPSCFLYRNGILQMLHLMVRISILGRFETQDECAFKLDRDCPDASCVPR